MRIIKTKLRAYFSSAVKSCQLCAVAGAGSRRSRRLPASWSCRARRRPAGPCAARRAYLAGATVHGQLAAAAEAGVTILTGTDPRLRSMVIHEIHALAEAGVPAHRAIGAASLAARPVLPEGISALGKGAPANAVIYGADRRRDLGQLAAPRAVVLRRC